MVGMIKRVIADRCYRFKPEGFTLSSGRVSKHYIDCRSLCLDSRTARLIGASVLRLATSSTRGVDLVIGGLELGAVPMVAAVSCAAESTGVHIAGVAVRKKPKGHGVGGTIMGDMCGFSKGIAVDDVATSGGSLVKAVVAMRAATAATPRSLPLPQSGGESYDRMSVDLLPPNFHGDSTESDRLVDAMVTRGWEIDVECRMEPDDRFAVSVMRPNNIPSAGVAWENTRPAAVAEAVYRALGLGE